ncbi:hypothetical protein GBAR_LOCUS18582 [Geodia barretti]|uniref:Uncharacterized protein n=1 Tax=Geodia barretti TaxID=519541 RepID=A0AA35WU69_GEOBA|nr:hypothetical protein GBAR_LOCUS18582 [Geodia barretti]
MISTSYERQRIVCCLESRSRNPVSSLKMFYFKISLPKSFFSDQHCFECCSLCGHSARHRANRLVQCLSLSH